MLFPNDSNSFRNYFCISEDLGHGSLDKYLKVCIWSIPLARK